MLTYFQEKDLVRISDQQPANWEEAIRISCDNLIEKEIINQIYVDEVVAAVHKYGPYIVIVPGVAMPQSTDKSEGVFGTAIAFTKFKEKIYFEAGNEEKQAKLFFTLAAKNPDEHIASFQNAESSIIHRLNSDKIRHRDDRKFRPLPSF